MSNKRIDLKLKIFTVSTIILTAIILIYSVFLTYNKNTFYPTANKGRLLTNSVVINIEEALSKNDFNTNIESKYPYAVIDLKGKVLYSSINRYPKDSVVNMKEFIEYDNKTFEEEPDVVKYSAPLIINNTQIGTVIFFITEDEFLLSSPVTSTLINLAPIITAIVIIIILIISIYGFLKKDILDPLNLLHESARRILKGDFSYKVQYDYDSEIGSFCHDFEAMRDEIKFSKEKEQAIKSNEKELLACLSHDIKTPLTAIHGYVSGIKDGIVKDKNGIDSYCTIILNRVKMLNKLLDDILEHSKAELNKMDISLEEFYCGNFFRDILEDLAVEVQNKKLQFIYPEKIPDLLINGDKKRLSQVMYNLVSNSIKYSKEDGSISIYFEDDDNYIYVYVKDIGMGINSADVPYIFNKFYRGEKSRNQNISGSGLGLSISKYIIEAHGGFIKCVESSSDGTTICFTLPK